VTLFERDRHFYRPQDRSKLRRLTRPGGLVFIDGQHESFWPRQFGVNQWW